MARLQLIDILTPHTGDTRIRETLNLSTDADRSTDTALGVPGGVPGVSGEYQGGNVGGNAPEKRKKKMAPTATPKAKGPPTPLNQAPITPQKSPCMFLSASVILSASVERFGVSRMRDFLTGRASL